MTLYSKLIKISALKQVKLLFAGEKKICDQMLDGISFPKDQCFADVTTNSVATLLSFGDTVARSKRSPEKLFVLLDMYEIMRELHPEVGNKSSLSLSLLPLSLTHTHRHRRRHRHI